jgi:hypothetical protein
MQHSEDQVGVAMQNHDTYTTQKHTLYCIVDWKTDLDAVFEK